MTDRSPPLALTDLAGEWAGLAPAPLDARLRELRGQGRAILDLVTANPHEHGLKFPGELLAEIAAEAMQSIGVYRPEPRGLAAAREAVAQWYARRGSPAAADTIQLCPGTSTGYGWALRLLAEAGDEILAPSPGYPLFDDLAAVAGLRLRKYYLRFDGGGWRHAVDEIDYQCTARTRAVVLISPHNPTGAMATPEDLAALAEVCRRRRLALLFDEVFCEFREDRAHPAPRPHGEQFPLAITLNGCSKMLSLPGWKLAWMKVDGEPRHVRPFMTALEHLADTYLPLPDLQQAMLPALLTRGEAVTDALAEAYQQRRRAARTALAFATDDCTAGVYLCGRLFGAYAGPGGDDQFALDALEREGVLVHPGYFYDLPGRFVLTCVAAPETLRTGIDKLNRLAGGG